MAQVKILTPQYLGNTLKQDASTHVYNVNVKPEDFEVGADGVISLKQGVLDKLNKTIASGNVDGSNLKLQAADGTEITIDVSSLVPAAKADRFLAEVTYDSTAKKFVFKTKVNGSTEEQMLEVPVQDLMVVVVGNGLEGDGSTSNPLKIKTPTDAANPIVVDSEGIKLDQTKLQALAKETRDVELVDVAGNSIGWAYSAK